MHTFSLSGNLKWCWKLTFFNWNQYNTDKGICHAEIEKKPYITTQKTEKC